MLSVLPKVILLASASQDLNSGNSNILKHPDCSVSQKGTVNNGKATEVLCPAQRW